MNILGMGFLEIIVIFLIAFVLVGPDRMVEMAKKAGKLVRELQKLSEGLQESIAMSELDDLDLDLTGTRNLFNPSRPRSTGPQRDLTDDDPVSFKAHDEAASGSPIAAAAPDSGPEGDESDAAAEKDDPDEHESGPDRNGATR